MESKIIEILAYTLPSIITGAVAYYFFQMYLKGEDDKRNFQLVKENQRQGLPIRLQAYERMTLFLERIHPAKLLIRVAPFSEDKYEYENLLVSHIEQEFEHNLSQQIYMTDACWTIIVTAKNTLIQNIRKANISAEINTASQLREAILTDLMEQQPSTIVALSYIKSEVLKLV